MGIYDSKLWTSDLDEMLETLPELNELVGQKVMITGGTGLICSAVVDLLIRWNEMHDQKIQINLAGRHEKKVNMRFAPYNKEKWFTFVPYDATSAKNTLDFSCDYIIHGASNASPNKIVKEPVETMLSNFVGMKNLLDFAKQKDVKRVLYISSSEVYGKRKENQPYKFNEYSYVDILNSRNSYSIGKRASETLCVSYMDEYGVESVIVRPGHIYGPTAVESDNRVSSAWAYSAVRGEDIIMKSDGAQIRSYCYCLDCAAAILKVLLKGACSQAYNISNPDSIINIREMAEILAKSAGVKVRMELPNEEECRGFNPMSNSALDSTELLALGWNGLFSAERGFRHTVKILKEMSAQKKGYSK